MKKFLQIMLHEYQRNVFRWRFLFALLSLPLFALCMSGVMLLSFLPELSFQPVGYVDGAGILGNIEPKEASPASGNLLRYLAFESEMLARQALDKGKIQAYYVLQDDYRESGAARLVVSKRVSLFVRLGFSDLLRERLLAGQPEPVVQRMNSSGSIEVRTLDGSLNIGPRNWLNYLAPFFASGLLMLAIFTTAGYMMNVIVEERENRTLEVLLTSVTPFQLIGGKTSGLILVGFTQLLLWFMPLLLLFFSSSNSLRGLDPSQHLFETLAIILASVIPVFITYAAFLSVIGAATEESGQAQMLSSILNLPFIIPILLFFVIYNNPQGSLAIALSLLPPTAPITLGIRSITGPLPPEQIALSLGVLTFIAIIAVWLSGYVWKAGWQFGKGVRLRWLPRRRKKLEELP
jgi:ABC-2 type transport system permease protein